jgi:uncharacterized membrane protein YkgB
MTRILQLGSRIERFGGSLLRYGVVLLLVWIGVTKFYAWEAAAIRPLVESQPLTAWLYRVFSEQPVSNLIGVSELLIAALVALRPVSARLCALGSALAIPLFLTTISFLFTLPGWEPSVGGFPWLSLAGGFLVKDLILLGAMVWSLGESLGAMRDIRHPIRQLDRG